MSNREHNRSYFFKYASFETAIKVIESKSFKWSSPTQFNDPFDHQTKFLVNFTCEEFAKCLTASIERIIYSEVIPERPESIIVEFASRLLSSNLTRRQISQKLSEISISVGSNVPEHIEVFNNQLQQILCHSRVFCVSENHDNVVMWSHYADEHKGVVFKLRSSDEIDTPLLIAKKVNYSDTFPIFLDADQFAKQLTGEQLINIPSLCWKLPFTKHNDWSYEKEWRVHEPLVDTPPGEGYDYFPEDPRVFEAIFLGCRMKPPEISKITALIKQHLPETKILQGYKSDSSFSLIFDEHK